MDGAGDLSETVLKLHSDMIFPCESLNMDQGDDPNLPGFGFYVQPAQVEPVCGVVGLSGRQSTALKTSI